MARGCITTLIIAVMVALSTPLAHARTPCATERAAPTALNSGQVSDAIFCLTNHVRAHYGLPAFRRDARLDTAALLHSADMALRNYFAHATPEGLTPGDRAAAQGYTSGVGENIASGYDDGREVVLGWMASAGHCRNILGGALDLGVGTGLASAPYYTQDFGDYFSQPFDQAPRNGCPYSVDLDALTVATKLSTPLATTVAPRALPASPAPAALPALARGVGKPSLGALRLSPRRFRAGARGASISYTLSAGATVAFSIQRELRCPARRAKACLRYQTMAGNFTTQGEAGTNTLRFSGRLRGRRLKPGRYRLVATATEPTGSAFAVKRIRFVLVRR